MHSPTARPKSPIRIAALPMPVAPLILTGGAPIAVSAPLGPSARSEGRRRVQIARSFGARSSSVNAGEKMYQRAGVKLHHRGVPNAPPEGVLLHDKQDKKRIASSANVPETSSVASPSVLPLPQSILRPAPAPLLNPKSMLTDVGPVELWATRWRRPSAAANPRGFYCQ